MCTVLLSYVWKARGCTDSRVQNTQHQVVTIMEKARRPWRRVETSLHNSQKCRIIRGNITRLTQRHVTLKLLIIIKKNLINCSGIYLRIIVPRTV